MPVKSPGPRPVAGRAELDAAGGTGWLPCHAARAELLARLGRAEAARADYDAALALNPAPAEALFLSARRDASVAA